VKRDRPASLGSCRRTRLGFEAGGVDENEGAGWWDATDWFSFDLVLDFGGWSIDWRASM